MATSIPPDRAVLPAARSPCNNIFPRWSSLFSRGLPLDFVSRCWRRQARRRPPQRIGPANRRCRCEYLRDPASIDVLRPRLSWILQSHERGQRQTAYQVLVASALELLAKDNGDLWDSGRVESDQSSQISYAGKPLPSRQRCFGRCGCGIGTGANPGGVILPGGVWGS